MSILLVLVSHPKGPGGTAGASENSQSHTRNVLFMMHPCKTAAAIRKVRSSKKGLSISWRKKPIRLHSAENFPKRKRGSLFDFISWRLLKLSAMKKALGREAAKKKMIQDPASHGCLYRIISNCVIGCSVPTEMRTNYERLPACPPLW